jgi:hypothetical protein
MLDFIREAFKGLFTLCIWIVLILVAIGGIMLLETNPLLTLAIWSIGFIFIILSAGTVSIFIKIDENIQYIRDNLNRDNFNRGNLNRDNLIDNTFISHLHSNLHPNPKAKICPFCAEEIKPEAKICPHCRHDIQEYEIELKNKEIEDKKRREQNIKNIEDIFNDEDIMNEAKKLRRLYGKEVYISYLKDKAKELGLGNIDLSDIE